MQQSSKHNPTANVCPAGRCWELKCQQIKCTLDTLKHSKSCCFQLPDLWLHCTAHADPASAQREPKLIPLGICDEHHLNQTHFTEIQDKTCNDFSHYIVVLQLSFLMCHSHCYWQPKSSPVVSGCSRVQFILGLNHYIQCPASMSVVPAHTHLLPN